METIKLKSLIPGTVEEDYPSNWNLETFKALKSFKNRIAYCNQHLKRLSSGSSRIAYKVDEEKVLKLAKNRKGIAQNSVERDWYVQDAYSDIVAKVFAVDENDLWLEMELAKKLTPNRFKELVGTSVENIGMYLKVKDERDNGKNPIISLYRLQNAKLDNNEWVQQVYTLTREVDLQPGDFGRISSYGEVIRNGKPAVVIIDMGLSKTVWNDFYGVN
jgi:hypothetical protein